MRNPRPCRGALVTVLAFAACGEQGEEATLDVPEATGQVELSIGQLDGPAEYAFGQVSGVTEGPDGLVYVSDGLQHTIRVFTSGGTFLRSIGRQGEGPGELQRPCCIVFGEDGHLWVRDRGNRRYVSYDVSQAEPLAVGHIRMNHFDGGLTAPVTFSPEGYLIDVGHHTGPDGALGIWRFAISTDGAKRDEVRVLEPSPEALGTAVVEREVPGGRSRSYFPQPYGPRSLVAHGPNGMWATAVSTQYTVSLHGGDTTTEIRGPVGEGPALSAGERDGAAAQIRGYVERGGGGPSDYPAVPDRKPPLADLYFDALGRLWVELSVPQGSARRADVYDADGTLVERRVWPAEVDLSPPAWLGEAQALGIAQDSLGVQRVAKLRFHQ